METIKHKKTKGRVRVLKASLYKDHMVYIRMVGADYFEYLVVHNGEVYSSYIIITPREGKKKLSKKEIEECSALIYTGAEATIDALTDTVQVSEEGKNIIDTFESARDIVEAKE